MHFVSVPDMKVSQENKLTKKFFGEGCDCIVDQNNDIKCYQLTWQENTIFEYNEDLENLNTYAFPEGVKEGWGIAHKVDEEDGNQVTNLYITDGSNNVYIVDPATMKTKKTIPVTDQNGNPLYYLNELEFVKGKLLANVYLTTEIAVINVDTGVAEKFIDMTDLKTKAASYFGGYIDDEFCLNGIAYDEKNDRLIVTGKKWPFMAEIKLKIDFQDRQHEFLLVFRVNNAYN
eukprot:TRINITY_DN7373_c0_g1_i2.p1 TRINITY_DN7373_c0_g1~~TRINITY_DN7373_c0_g1_i2.p1  ORF type:complete len:231 (+),score=91.05 TRINITY_DN7373_c0_g1_i2:377-1069(+)